MAIDFITSALLWLGWGGVVGGGRRGRGGGIFGAGRGGGRAGGRGGELFYCDGDKVGSDIGDHNILAAWRHFGVPVRVSLGRHPLGFGGGRALVPGWDGGCGGGRWAFSLALARIFPGSLWGLHSVQGTTLLVVFQGRRGWGGEEGGRWQHWVCIRGRGGSGWLGALPLLGVCARFTGLGIPAGRWGSSRGLGGGGRFSLRATGAGRRWRWLVLRGGGVVVPGCCAGAWPWVGRESRRASTLQPEWLPVHREPQHLQGRLERSIWGLSLFPNDTIAWRDVLASCWNIPTATSCATPAWLVNDLQVEDDPTSLDLSWFDPTVEDADGLGERRDVHAGGETTRVRESRPCGVWAGQRTPGHPVATVNVLL